MKQRDTNGIESSSSDILIDPEMSVLPKGLDFYTTPRAPDIGTFISELYAFRDR